MAVYPQRSFNATVYAHSADGDQYRAVATVDGRTYSSATTTIKRVTPTQTPAVEIHLADVVTVPAETPWGVAQVPVTATVTGEKEAAESLSVMLRRKGFEFSYGTGLELAGIDGAVATYSGYLQVPTAGSFDLGYSYLARDVENFRDLHLAALRDVTVKDPVDSGLASIEALTISQPDAITAGKEATLVATASGGGDDVGSGAVAFYLGGYKIGVGVYKNGKWSLPWVPTYAATSDLTARYTKEGYNPASSAPVSVSVEEFDIRFSVPAGSSSSPTSLDPIKVGASTVSLQKGDVELSFHSADDLALSDWVAHASPRQLQGNYEDFLAPVITIDGDDNRIRISAPQGTTPGTYEIRFSGRVGSGWASPSARYTIEVQPA